MSNPSFKLFTSFEIDTPLQYMPQELTYDVKIAQSGEGVLTVFIAIKNKIKEVHVEYDVSMLAKAVAESDQICPYITNLLANGFANVDATFSNIVVHFTEHKDSEFDVLLNNSNMKYPELVPADMIDEMDDEFTIAQAQEKNNAFQLSFVYLYTPVFDMINFKEDERGVIVFAEKPKVAFNASGECVVVEKDSYTLSKEESLKKPLWEKMVAIAWEDHRLECRTRGLEPPKPWEGLAKMAKDAVIDSAYEFINRQINGEQMPAPLKKQREQALVMLESITKVIIKDPDALSELFPRPIPLATELISDLNQMADLGMDIPLRYVP